MSYYSSAGTMVMPWSTRPGLSVCRSLRLVVVAEDGGVVLGIEVVEPLAHESLVAMASRRELRNLQSCLPWQS